MTKILAFAGSTRKDSYNKKLVKNVIPGAESAGVEVKFIDLKDYPLPLYDGDLEEAEGIPENAKKLKALMKESAGFIIASPEYNGGMSGVLKNTIDWTSRPEGDEPPMVSYANKFAAIVSASPGALGGILGLPHLRYILENIGVTVLAAQVTIREAHNAFDENGILKEERKLSQAKNLGKKLGELLN